MRTYRLLNGSLRKLAAPAALSLLVLAGCAHRELTAPCSDYKRAAFTADAPSPTIPCDKSLPMQRPPWVASLDHHPPVSGGRG